MLLILNPFLWDSVRKSLEGFGPFWYGLGDIGKPSSGE